MKRFIILFVLVTASLFIIGCDGDNDDDRDSDHDAKLSSISSKVLALTGSGAGHVDKNGCTDSEIWTEPVEAVAAVAADDKATPPVIAVIAVDAVDGFCS